MKRDIKSNCSLIEVLAAKSYAAGVENSAAIDMTDGASVSFLVSVGTVGSSASVNAKLQYSANGTTGWTDDTGSSGNTVAITAITAAGAARMHVISPMARYYRVVTTVGTAACVVGVTGVLGPLHHVSAE
jgi:hypothetical protein